MTKVRQRASLPVDAVKLALEREHQKREDIKPIELLKVALSAYLAFTFNEDEANAKATAKTPLESTDSAALRRGTQAAVDRLLFNANYWRAAYESRVFEACERPENARQCLQALSVWTAHTLKLNTLSPDEAVATFERFCPPFALNRRRGSHNRDRAGKGPLPDFKRAIDQIGKVSFAYINKILSSWHDKGITTTQQAAQERQSAKAMQKSEQSSIDFDQIQQYITYGGQAPGRTNHNRN